VDQTRRIESLLQTQDENVLKAELIEQNLDDVDKAILVIRSGIANGMDWQELNRIVKLEKKNGNPIANIIESLKLDHNKISLYLSGENLPRIVKASDSKKKSKQEVEEEEEEDNNEKLQVYKIDVDISLTAHANARMYYDTKKVQAVKYQKNY